MSTFGQKLKDVIMGNDQELILTPRIEAWRSTQRSYSPATVDRLAELLSDDSNSDRSARFGASSRGDCDRRQVLAYLGERSVFKADTMGIFEDGTWRHMRWQAAGLEAGWFTGVEVKYAVPEYRVTVSLDGENADEGWFFELKGTSNLSKVKSEGVPEKHLLQIGTCMLASGWSTAVYVAECKRTQQWHEIVVHQEDVPMEAVERELERLNGFVNRQELPSVLMGCMQRKGPEYRGCQFRDVCLEKEEWHESGA